PPNDTVKPALQRAAGSEDGRHLLPERSRALQKCVAHDIARALECALMRLLALLCGNPRDLRGAFAGRRSSRLVGTVLGAHELQLETQAFVKRLIGDLQH